MTEFIPVAIDTDGGGVADLQWRHQGPGTLHTYRQPSDRILKKPPTSGSLVGAMASRELIVFVFDLDGEVRCLNVDDFS